MFFFFFFFFFLFLFFLSHNDSVCIAYQNVGHLRRGEKFLQTSMMV